MYPPNFQGGVIPPIAPLERCRQNDYSGLSPGYPGRVTTPAHPPPPHHTSLRKRPPTHPTPAHRVQHTWRTRIYLCCWWPSGCIHAFGCLDHSLRSGPSPARGGPAPEGCPPARSDGRPPRSGELPPAGRWDTPPDAPPRLPWRVRRFAATAPPNFLPITDTAYCTTFLPHPTARTVISELLKINHGHVIKSSRISYISTTESPYRRVEKRISTF